MGLGGAREGGSSGEGDRGEDTGEGDASRDRGKRGEGGPRDRRWRGPRDRLGCRPRRARHVIAADGWTTARTGRGDAAREGEDCGGHAEEIAARGGGRGVDRARVEWRAPRRDAGARLPERSETSRAARRCADDARDIADGGDERTRTGAGSAR